MKRRTFLALLGGTGAGVAAAALPATANAAPTGDFPGYPDSNGVLHDTTLCIGCRRCEAACAEINKLPQPKKPFDDLKVLDVKRRTTAVEWTVVNKYEQPGQKPVFRKAQCLHCAEPACASACFVRAFTKNPDGSVTYDASLCVGCRYCMVACPFNIPGYTYDRALNPLVQKCTLCHPLISEGRLPACVQTCPTGALVFGKREDLLVVARKRLLDNPARYQNHIYGEHEMGGTAWMTISGAPFAAVGLDEHLGVKAAGEYTAGVLGAVPMVVGLWPVLLGGAYAITRRKEQIAAEEQAEAVSAATRATEAKADAALQKALAKAAREQEKATAVAVDQAVTRTKEDMKEEMAEAVKTAALEEPDAAAGLAVQQEIEAALAAQKAELEARLQAEQAALAAEKAVLTEKQAAEKAELEARVQVAEQAAREAETRAQTEQAALAAEKAALQKALEEKAQAEKKLKEQTAQAKLKPEAPSPRPDDKPRQGRKSKDSKKGKEAN